MKCSRCQHENETGAKFCEECATPLARTCVNCGRPLSAAAKFCPECAYPTGAESPAPARFTTPESYTPNHLAERILVSRAALEGERKQVTVLFADLKGPMELLADRDPEEARKILDAVLERMMDAVHRFEGSLLSRGHGNRRGAGPAAYPRALPPRPRPTLFTHRQASEGQGTFHRREDDVPRDGHGLLADAGRTGSVAVTSTRSTAPGTGSPCTATPDSARTPPPRSPAAPPPPDGRASRWPLGPAASSTGRAPAASSS